MAQLKPRVVLAIVAGTGILCVCGSSHLGLVEELVAWALLMTLAVITWYAWTTGRLASETAKQTQDLASETGEMRRATQDAHTFQALIAIHSVMSNRRSYLLRRYLHDGFDVQLMSAVKDPLGPQYVHGGNIDLRRIAHELGPDTQKLASFNRSLGA